jgi:hypothetical protein
VPLKPRAPSNFHVGWLQQDKEQLPVRLFFIFDSENKEKGVALLSQAAFKANSFLLFHLNALRPTKYDATKLNHLIGLK